MFWECAREVSIDSISGTLMLGLRSGINVEDGGVVKVDSNNRRMG